MRLEKTAWEMMPLEKSGDCARTLSYGMGGRANHQRKEIRIEKISVTEGLFVFSLIYIFNLIFNI